MDVAIIGAAGDCGRHIAGRLASDHPLRPTERLQLVGRADGRSAHVLHGLATDLQDANAETCPEIDVALAPDDVVADIIVFIAGTTVSDPRAGPQDRDALARTNAALFREYAESLACNGSGTEVVLVVTNPVELGVEVFARALGRHRVIGIGAYSDTLRFRREVAAELGVRRQLVQGFALGEHGDGMLPLWSTIHVHGFEDSELDERLPRRADPEVRAGFEARLSAEKAALLGLLREGLVGRAFAHADALPPDLRVALRPYATQLSGAKTAFTTGSVVVDLVQTLLDGREIVIAGQVRLEGEMLGIRGVTGAPIVVGTNGWREVVPLALRPEEEAHSRLVAARIAEKIARWERP